MKVAILGVRGIPAKYGGYDTLAEELATGLVKKNFTDVIVYCRSGYYKNKLSNYGGVELVYLPSPHIKGIESLFHSFISSLHVLFKKIDVIYFVDPANAPFCLLLRLFGRKVIIHTDGLGWKRRKWGPMARRYYKFVEWLSARVASALITDNPAMQEYYTNEYGVKSAYISYGAESSHEIDEKVYGQLNLTPHNYLLVVARLEPDNNTDLVIEEYVKAKVKMPLVIVGDSPYNSQYMTRLHSLANEQVIFVGRVNDQPKLNALYKGAYLYIHGHDVGGTNPSLLRAMNVGVAPLVIDASFNVSVIAEAGLTFDRKQGSLARIIEHSVENPSDIKQIAKMAQNRAETNYTWDKVVCEHDQLFRQIT